MTLKVSSVAMAVLLAVLLILNVVVWYDTRAKEEMMLIAMGNFSHSLPAYTTDLTAYREEVGVILKRCEKLVQGQRDETESTLKSLGVMNHVLLEEIRVMNEETVDSIRKISPPVCLSRPSVPEKKNR